MASKRGFAALALSIECKVSFRRPPAFFPRSIDRSATRAPVGGPCEFKNRRGCSSIDPPLDKGRLRTHFPPFDRPASALGRPSHCPIPCSASIDPINQPPRLSQAALLAEPPAARRLVVSSRASRSLRRSIQRTPAAFEHRRRGACFDWGACTTRISCCLDLIPSVVALMCPNPFVRMCFAPAYGHGSRVDRSSLFSSLVSIDTRSVIIASHVQPAAFFS